MTIYSKIKRKVRIYLGKITTWVAHISMRLNGVNYGNKVVVRGYIHIQNAGEIFIGDNVVINSSRWANPMSCASGTNLQIIEGVLEIGDKSGLSNASITCYEKITIGKNVLIGAGTQIFDTDFHPIISKYRFGDEKKMTLFLKKQ